MCGLLDRKRREGKTKNLGEDAELMSSGFISPKQGLAFTSERAMNLIRANERHRLHALLTAEAEANRKAMQSARREYKPACEGSTFWEARWEKRAALCGVSVD